MFVLLDMLKRMKEDQTKFGKTAFELIGTERFFRYELYGYIF